MNKKALKTYIFGATSLIVVGTVVTSISYAHSNIDKQKLNRNSTSIETTTNNPKTFDFTAAINESNSLIKLEGEYKTKLLLKDYVSFTVRAQQLSTKAKTIESSLTADQKTQLTKATTNITNLKSEIDAVKTLNDYAVDPSTAAKTEFETKIKAYEAIAKAATGNQKELAFIANLNSLKSFADSLTTLRTLYSNTTSADFQWKTFSEQLKKAHDSFKTLSENKTITSDDTGKLILLKLELSLGEIQNQFSINKELIESILNSSNTMNVPESTETEFKKLISGIKISILDILNKQQNITKIPVDKAKTLYNEIEGSIVSASTSAYLKVADALSSFNNLVQNYTENPTTDLKAEITKTHNRIQLQIDKTKAIVTKINNMNNSPETTTNEFSKIVEKYKKDHADDTAFADEQLTDYNDSIKKITDKKTELKTENDALKKALEVAEKDTSITNEALEKASDDLEFSNWKIVVLNSIFISPSNIFNDIATMVESKNNALKIKTDIQDKFNSIAKIKKTFYDSVDAIGVQITDAQNKIFNNKSIVSIYPALITDIETKIKTLDVIKEKTPDQTAELDQLQKTLTTYNATLEKAKTDKTASETLLAAKKAELKTKIDSESKDNILGEFIAVGKTIVPDTEKISKIIKDAGIQGSLPEYNFNIRLTNGIGILSALKDFLEFYYDNTGILFTTNYENLSSVDGYINNSKENLNIDASKSSLDIFNSIFGKIYKDIEIYNSFSKAISEPSDENISKILNLIKDPKKPNTPFENLITTFLDYIKSKSQLRNNISDEEKNKILSKLNEYKRALNNSLSDNNSYSAIEGIIRNFLVNNSEVILENQIKLIQEAKNFLAFGNYDKDFLTKDNEKIDAIFSDKSINNFEFFKALASDYDYEKNVAALLTNKDGNAAGDKLKDLVSKFTTNGTIDVAGISSLRESLLETDKNVGINDTKAKMLNVLNFLDKADKLRILALNLDSVFNPNSTVSKAFLEKQSIVLQNYATLLETINTRSINAINSYISKIVPNMDNDILAFQQAINTLQEKMSTSTLTPDEQSKLESSTFVLKTIKSALDAWNQKKNELTNFAKTVEAAKKTLIDFQNNLINSLSEELKAKYANSVANKDVVTKALIDAKSKKRTMDNDFDYLTKIVNVYLDQTQRNELAELVKNNKDFKTSLDKSTSAYTSAKKQMDDFLAKVQSSEMTILPKNPITEANTETTANPPATEKPSATELKTQETVLIKKIATIQAEFDKVRSDKNNLLNQEIKNKVKGYEQRNYFNELIRKNQLWGLISTANSDITDITRKLAEVTKIPVKDRTYQQAEDFILLGTNLTNTQDNLAQYNAELTELNNSIKETVNLVVLHFTVDQKTKYEELQKLETEKQIELINEKKNLEILQTKIADLDNAAINIAMNKGNLKTEYETLKQTFDQAKANLTVSQNNFDANYKKLKVFNMILIAVFTPEQIVKYETYNDESKKINDALTLAMTNYENNADELKELQALEDDKINKSDEAEKLKLANAKHIVNDEEAVKFELTNSIVLARIDLSISYSEAIIKVSSDALSTLEFQKEYGELLAKKMENDTSDEGKKKLKELEDALQELDKNISERAKAIPELKASYEKLKLLKQNEESKINSEVVQEYQKVTRAINDINKNVLNTNSASDVQTSSLSILKSTLDEFKNDSTKNLYSWSDNEIKKYDYLINAFSAKNAIDKSNSVFIKSPTDQNEVAYNQSVTTFLNTLNLPEGISFDKSPLSPLVSKLNSFKEVLTLKSELLSNAQKYFDDPNDSNTQLVYDTIAKFTNALKKANEELDVLEKATNKDELAIADKKQEIAELMKITAKSDKFDYYINEAKMILDATKQLDDLRVSQLKSRVNNIKDKLFVYRDDDADQDLWNIRNLLKKSLTKLENMIARKDFLERTNIKFYEYIRNQNSENFNDFYNFVLEFTAKDAPKNKYQEFANQLKAVKEAVTAYDRSNVTNLSSITVAIEEITKALKAIKGLTDTKVNKPDAAAFGIQTTSWFNGLISELKNAIENSSDAMNKLDWGIEAYANVPTESNIEALNEDIKNAQASRVDTNGIRRLLEIETKISDLESLLQKTKDITQQLKVAPILKTAEQINGRIDILLSILQKNSSFELIEDNFKNRLKNIEMEANIIGGSSINRGINNKLDKLIQLMYSVENINFSPTEINNEIKNLNKTNPNQETANQALAEKLKRFENQIKLKEMILKLSAVPTDKEIRDINSLYNNSLYTYGSIINVMNLMNDYYNSFYTLTKSKNTDDAIEKFKKIVDKNKQSVDYSQFLSDSNKPVISTFGDKFSKYELNSGYLIQAYSKLLSGIMNLSDKEIRESKDLFSKYNQEQSKSPVYSAQFVELYRILGNWEDVIKSSILGNISDREKIADMTNKLNKLTDIPPLFKSSIESKIKNLKHGFFEQIPTVILAIVIVLTVIFSGILIWIKKRKKRLSIKK